MRKSAFILMQYILPQHLLSALMHKIARCKASWFKNFLTTQFIKLFNVNMSEAAEPDPEQYEHFNAFFTRHLKNDARPLDDVENNLASPVDGTVSQLGQITNSQVFQAKGKHFNLAALLGSDTMTADFEDGSFNTIYLSPKDYHRIHFPTDGKLKKMVHIPGDLFSVNQTTVEAVDELFARNERVVAFFDTPAGPMAMVMVGAIFVSSIETVWHGEVTPPRHNQVRRWTYEDSALSFNKHDEMAFFNMGSTVILLYGKDAVSWEDELTAGQTVRRGQPIGHINK